MHGCLPSYCIFFSLAWNQSAFKRLR
jgi:hypothetical protein